jgi:LmbE family N-acetylglucosaminyl deacetylase
VELTVDASHLGTPESTWSSSGRIEALGPLELGRPRRVVVVAAHPDDEVLGAGGLIERVLDLGSIVEVIAVTDGEASHPYSAVTETMDLRSVRASESRIALRRLGWESPQVTRLCIPDGKVAEHLPYLSCVLAACLGPGDLCVAPWLRDGHADHDACGSAAVKVSDEVGASLLAFLVWAWHWADPEGADVPWARCRRLDLTRHQVARKRWGTSAFESQIRPLGSAPEDAPVLPAPLLRRFWRDYEVYVDDRSGP